jgi:hypothetical protein
MGVTVFLPIGDKKNLLSLLEPLFSGFLLIDFGEWIRITRKIFNMWCWRRMEDIK